MHVETESYEEEHNQLPFVEDVSEHRWSEEEEVSSDLGLETFTLVYLRRMRKTMYNTALRRMKLGSIQGA